VRRLGAGALRYVSVRKRGTVLVLALMFVSVTGAALAHASLRLAIIRHGYALSEKSREFRELEEDNRKLRLELSLLRSPARIEEVAHEKLGMRRPDPAEIRVVHRGERPPVAQLTRQR
jgi:cell division protein FtsL